MPKGQMSACLQSLEHCVSDQFPATFISESELIKAGCSVLKKGSGGAVSDAEGTTVFNVKRQGGLYFVLARVASHPVLAAAARFKSRNPPKSPENAFDVPTGHRVPPEDFSEVDANAVP